MFNRFNRRPAQFARPDFTKPGSPNVFSFSFNRSTYNDVPGLVATVGAGVTPAPDGYKFNGSTTGVISFGLTGLEDFAPVGEDLTIFGEFLNTGVSTDRAVLADYDSGAANQSIFIGPVTSNAAAFLIWDSTGTQRTLVSGVMPAGSVIRFLLHHAVGDGMQLDYIIFNATPISWSTTAVLFTQDRRAGSDLRIGNLGAYTGGLFFDHKINFLHLAKGIAAKNMYQMSAQLLLDPYRIYTDGHYISPYALGPLRGGDFIQSIAGYGGIAGPGGTAGKSGGIAG